MMVSDFKALTLGVKAEYPSAERMIEAWNEMSPEEREKLVEINQKVFRKYVAPKPPSETETEDGRDND